LAGLAPTSRDYSQRGLVATVEVSDPKLTAWQRFLPTGPFALLPVRNGYFNIVWSTTEEVAKAVENSSEESAVKAFNEVIEVSVGLCNGGLGSAWRSINHLGAKHL